MAERPELLGLATEIVSAHVRNNAVAADELPGLIQKVFNALATVEQATAAPPKPKPAVEVRRSVLPITLSAWIAASIFPCCGGT